MIQGEGENMNVGLYQWCYAQGKAELLKVNQEEGLVDPLHHDHHHH
jgi:hypothetical protein